MRNVRREIEARHTADALRSELPPDSSLRGLGDRPGGRGEFKFGSGPDNRSRLLLFVVHSASAPADVRFWDRTVSLVARAPGGDRISFWGICDGGAACSRYRPNAAFTMLGYLDPYEMRMMALAEARREALLYRGPKLPGLSVPVFGTPSSEARAILHEAE